MTFSENAFTAVAGMIGLVLIAGSFVTKTAMGINCPPLLSESMFLVGFLLMFGAGLYLGCNHFRTAS